MSRLLLFSVLCCCCFFGAAQEAQERNDSIVYFDKVDEEAIVFQERKIPDSVVDQLKKQDAYWYADYVAEKKQQPSSRSILQQRWFFTMLWVIILCAFVAILIWFLASQKISLFRKKAKSLHEEVMEESLRDIFTINYEKEIENAIKANNLRHAIRLMYWQILKLLHDKKFIQYRHGKTDNEYLYALSGTNLYSDFFRLTRSFQYTWYGKFHLGKESFTALQRHFHSFKNRLAS